MGDPGEVAASRGLADTGKGADMADATCETCGHTTLMPGSRKFCSGRCQMLESRRRRGENCRDSIECEGCGDVVSLAAKPGQRKKRSDTRYCPTCYRLRSLRLVGSGKISVVEARALGTTCGICSERVELDRRKPDPLSPSIDHVVPVAFGGSDDLCNLQMTHFGCNQRKHLREADRDYGRAERQRFYYSRKWRRLSTEVRANEPRCRVCGRPAVVVDHILGIEEGGDPWDRANLQPLCRRCHNRKSQQEYRERWSA